MDRQDAIAEVKHSIPITRYLKKAQRGGYCCPFCESGTGQHKTGGFKVYDDGTGFCHVCNNEAIGGKPADVIDLEMHATGADFNTALSTLAAERGIEIDAHPEPAHADPPRSDLNETRVENPDKEENGLKTQNTAAQGHDADYTEYYRQCLDRITDPAAVNYLIARGIHPDKAARYGIGYDPAADPASAPGGIGEKRHPARRIVVPVTKEHYVTRAIDQDIEPAFAKMNNKGSRPGIFNEKALYQAAPAIFVTEGVFNALSFLEVDAPAIALNSASNVDRLTDQIEKRHPAAPLILCFDRDDAGQRAENSLAIFLYDHNIPYRRADITGGYGDNNDYLLADRAGFTAAVKKIMQQVARPDNVGDYMADKMAGEIEALKAGADRLTGFDNLDKRIHSLYSGLYVVGGISSVGKTTFISQLADQLAAAGQHVLFFSLEQSRLELVSKSISRETAIIGKPERATNSLQIRLGASGPIINEAKEKYAAAVGDRLSIIEGNMDSTVDKIGQYVRGYISRNKVRPVVIVDYLQVLGAILDPDTGKKPADLKRIVDINVVELKRLSRDMEIPVIVASSVNRSNYLTPIDFESFKESGAIEFTADVVWGLQLTAIHGDIFEKDNNISKKREAVTKAKSANPRKVELVCLKNRYGISSYTCEFTYYPHCDYFVPADTGTDEKAATGPDAWTSADGGTPFDAQFALFEDKD